MHQVQIYDIFAAVEIFRSNLKAFNGIKFSISYNPHAEFPAITAHLSTRHGAQKHDKVKVETHCRVPQVFGETKNGHKYNCETNSNLSN